MYEGGDEVSFQWCSAPPYEAFSTDFVESSNESIEDVLKKYKQRGAKKAQQQESRTTTPDQPPPPAPVGCRGVGDDNTTDMMGALFGGYLDSNKGKVVTSKVAKIKADAMTVRSKWETEAKRSEALEKKRRAERKNALHHIPDLKERKEAERRLKKKLISLQIER